MKKKIKKSKSFKKKLRSLVFSTNYKNAAMLVVLVFCSIFLLKDQTLLPSKSTKSMFLTQTESTQSAKINLSPSPTTIPIPDYPVESGRQIHVPILIYHYIGNNPNPGKDPMRDGLSVPPDKFEEQMSYLSKNGYSTITLDTAYAALKDQQTLPQKPIIITFDDGYIDFYVNAYPILRKYNLKATQFIPTGLIDTSYYLHWDQIKEMDKSGLITFQAHTVDHLDLRGLPEDYMRSQILQSKQILEQKLGKPVNFFAYPFGYSNPAVWKMVKESGFIGAVGTWYGSTISEGTIYNLPRIKVAGTWQISDFAQNI